MIAFWIAAALISAAAAALIVRQAAAASAAIAGAEDPTQAVYRRQLAEIDDLAARGLLADSDLRSARTEAARRLLAAADRPIAAQTTSGKLTVLIAAAGAPLLALVAYLAIGSPGFPDRPFVTRLKEWQAADPSTLDPPHMAAVLEAVAAKRPRDPEPLFYLARAELISGDLASAERHLEKAAALAPGRADLWTTLGETFVAESKGEISQDAKTAFARALAIDPKAPSPRYHLARARIAGGDVAGGLADWRALAADLPAADQRRAGLLAEIEAVDRDHGLPAAPAQPQAGGADQQAFIRSMVAGLAARLKASPDDPPGWARLIRSYGVLGDQVRRQEAVEAMRRQYAAKPEVAKSIEAQASEAPK